MAYIQYREHEILDPNPRILCMAYRENKEYGIPRLKALNLIYALQTEQNTWDSGPWLTDKTDNMGFLALNQGSYGLLTDG